MKNKKNIILILITIILLLILIIFLSKTIFFNYKDYVNKNIKAYYNNENYDQLKEISKLSSKYNNDKNKLDNINKIIIDTSNNVVDNFNKEYNSIDELDSTYNYIKYKLNNLFDVLNIDYDKNTIINYLDKLYESKQNYNEGIKLYNEKKYDESFNNLVKVIDKDIYYDDSNNKINEIYNNEFIEIDNNLNEINKIDENTSLDNKIKIYKDCINYLKETGNNSKIDISNNDKYKDKLLSFDNNLYETYIEYVKDLADKKQYSDAISNINEAVSLLSKDNINTSELLELSDNYNNMLPKSLFTIETTYNDNIKKEMAIEDKDKTYEEGLAILKNDNKTSSVSYELNKEYKSFTANINITKNVKNKKYKYGRIKIYTDDKLIYDSKELTTKFSNKILNIDTNDINILKIEYTISSSKSINKNDIVVAVISNPTLNKY